MAPLDTSPVLVHGRLSADGEQYESDVGWAVVGNDTVLLVDLDRGNRTVSNDARPVLARLSRECEDLDTRSVLCRDTDGRIDRMLHRHGRFMCWAPGWLEPSTYVVLRDLARTIEIRCG